MTSFIWVMYVCTKYIRSMYIGTRWELLVSSSLNMPPGGYHCNWHCGCTTVDTYEYEYM